MSAAVPPSSGQAPLERLEAAVAALVGGIFGVLTPKISSDQGSALI